MTEQGIKICFDEKERQFARELFSPLNTILRDELLSSCLSLIYLYDQREQPTKIKKFDGYTSKRRYQKGEQRAAAIGISVQALHTSNEYAIMVFLHELTHILYESPKEHDIYFHNFLNFLIEKYNNATGAKIKNDYFGLS